MRAPTPVTVRAITTESGSARKATSAWNRPTVIQSHTFDTTSRSEDALPMRWNSRASAVTKDVATRSEASHPLEASRHRFPDRRRTAAPMRGNSGMSATSVMSSPQHSGVVDIRRQALAVERDDDGQANHDLSGGHHHGEERQHLPVEVPSLTGEGHQREIHRVQLQLDRHEDDQGVPADQDAHRADGEQQAGDDQEVADGRPHGSSRPGPTFAGCGRAPGPAPSPFPAGSPRGASMVSSKAMRRRPCIIAPMAATISRTLVISNGRK